MPDKLVFYSGSAHVYPGMGTREHVADPATYNELSKIYDWRRVLSNFYHCPFIYDGRTYNTVEHAFQAAKIKLADPHKAEWFSIESRHKIGNGDGLVARRHRKLVILNKEQISAWNIIKRRVMYHILHQKFADCASCRPVLLATGNAELWHAGPHIKPVRTTDLETIRDVIKNNSK